jgi:ABC-2 type transport system permease protein
MRGLLAVFHKELLIYFRSPIAYFVIAVFLLGTGYFFLFDVFTSGDAVMTQTFRSMSVLLITLLPMVSMRLFSSEYSGRTMDLLTTLPLKPWQVVLGKYFGALVILLLMVVATMINLIPMYLYGNPEWRTIFSGYVGFFLLGMACLALGQLFSALTENQIIAALVTMSVLLAFWFVGHLETYQSSLVLKNLFGYLSFADHLADFVRGLVRSEGIVFYLITCAIALTLNAGFLQWRR